MHSGPQVPGFLVTYEPRYRSGWEAAVALCTAGGPPATSGLTPRIPEQSAFYWPRRGLFPSVVLHCATVLFLTAFPLHLLQTRPAAEGLSQTVYELKKVSPSLFLPQLNARGPGGRPGRGTDPTKPPARGSTAFHPRQTVVSNPPRPDNTRQTIVQPHSPPDVVIRTELRLPNIVLGSSVAAPPSPRLRNLDAGMLGKPSPARLKAEALATPPVPMPELGLSPAPPVNPFPRLTLPSLPPPSGVFSSFEEGAVKRTLSAGLQWNVSPGPGLLVLGVEPGPPTDSLSIPPGNRYGDFSISPFGGQPGSPGGVHGGSLEGGTGGAGSGGDGSTAVGPGGSGGGGGDRGGRNILSISGGPETSGPAMASASIPPRRGALETSLDNKLVYPVGKLPRIRRGTLTVTTGPTGGGGLRVYGVLQGGKIYTIYLPMPGKNWVLQYSLVAPKSPAQPARTRAVAARLDHGLVPPSPREQFDFHRPPVPPDKAQEFIVLHGTLREDGTIGDLRLLRGVDPAADQAASAAFSRWKFDPALRDGKPIPLDILVGVPSTLPPAVREHAELPTADRRTSGQ